MAAGVVAALLAVAGHGVVGDMFVKARDVAALREERELLTAEVERLRATLAVENATSRELEQQAADLNAEVARLGSQVEFLKAGRTARKSAE